MVMPSGDLSYAKVETQQLSGLAPAGMPRSGPGVSLLIGSLSGPTPLPLPVDSQKPPPKEFSVLKLETKLASGEVLPPDVRANLAPGVQMLIGSRRVMRCTLFEATKTNNTGTLPYYGLVQPKKKDITFLVSRLHGIQAIYKKAGSVDEPMLVDNQVPTITTVSFARLIIDSDEVEEELERDRARAREAREAREEFERSQRPPPPPYEYPDSVHNYFKRKREDDEFDRRLEKRAKADHTNSKVAFYLMGIATGAAFKYLL